MLTLENYFIEKGIEKGKIEGKIETARAMKKKGFDIKLIAEITGLSVKEIEGVINT